MRSPLISIILPVFNSGSYLEQAISSLLHQSFTDFEILVINDGSTDDSEHVILSFRDERIIYINNEENKGLVFSLNRGIELAKGRYIARMDADDIAEEKRLESQFNFLEANSEVGILATAIYFINQQNDIIGEWYADKIAATPATIKRMMFKENCISHPTVMVRSDLLRKLRYRSYQKNIEDFDLWLRALNQGVVISKLNRPLLRYRIHDSSVTVVDRKKKNVFFKLAKCKLRFVYHELSIGKPNKFVATVFAYACIDLLKGFAKEVKNLWR